ncbi:SdpI family protein [Hymenobacter humi]|uniref:SdpI family protein n=1 Tax=Hymenobacter humi TaxID=1411620 RepID=A0ABW2UDV6_9BACT
MKKNLLPWQILTLVLLALPSLYLALSWSALPEQLPTHFGLDGRPNGFTSRANMWWMTLALPVGVALLLTVLPKLDPKRRLDGSTANFQKLRLALVGLVSGLACYSIYMALHPGAGSDRGVLVLLGVSFAFLGNYLTTVQPNYFVGIRTPWTLESATVWARTHRVGGILFFVSGLAIAGLALLLPMAWMKTIVLVLIIGTAVFCYAYSFVVYRQQQRLPESM